MRRYENSNIHPALQVIIVLLVYSLGYICGSINQKQTEVINSNSSDISKNINQEQINTINSNSYNTNETSPSEDELKALKYRITYDISYSDLNENEKEFYDKILSTAINEDNTFITDKELNFDLYTQLSKDESLRVQAVLYNNYPNVTFYTTRYPDSWIYYVTHYINGMPIRRTYYFNVKYK